MEQNYKLSNEEKRSLLFSLHTGEFSANEIFKGIIIPIPILTEEYDRKLARGEITNNPIDKITINKTLRKEIVSSSKKGYICFDNCPEMRQCFRKFYIVCHTKEQMEDIADL